MSRELTVEVVAGDGRIATAAQVSSEGWPDGAPVVLLATADGFADALAAAPLAGRLGAPILLVGDRLPAVVTEEIRRLEARAAVIAGAITAVPYVVQVEVEELGLTVRRVAGDSRVDTAALLAREVAGSDEVAEVAVASAGQFADALAFAPLAARYEVPVLLTAPTELPDDTAATLAELAPSASLVLGGTDVISEAVEARLPDPRRVAGADRYDTAVAIAELALERGASPAITYIATGRDFPDALAAGPLAALTDSPLLLVDGQDEDGAAGAYAFLTEHADDIDRVVVLGGDAAVNEAVRRRLAQPWQHPG